MYYVLHDFKQYHTCVRFLERIIVHVLYVHKTLMNSYQPIRLRFLERTDAHIPYIRLPRFLLNPFNRDIRISNLEV